VKKEIKKMWLEDLRSGTYRQGVGQLRESTPGLSEEYDKFCCLGLLTLRYALEHGEEFNKEWDARPYLPEEVVEWAGLHSDNPVMPFREDFYRDLIDPGAVWRVRDCGGPTLSLLNDADVPFPAIADLIEENIVGE
jgi:hypothetical protein